MDLPKRFWDKVAYSPGCWMWTGSKNNKGYPQFRHEGRTQLAHRLAANWAGQDPAGLCVCHTCDTPLCVNPDHLWVGTQQENLEDRDAKGRMCVGSARSQSKLTEEGVREMRRRYDGGELVKNIAPDFGLSESRCYVVAARKENAWRHVK